MQTLYFCPVRPSFFPRLISAVADLEVYHTSSHDVALSANLECMSEMCCTRLAANTGCKKSPSVHPRTILSDYIFATKACIGNREKNLLNSIISSTCPDNMVNFGILADEIVSLVWGPQLISTGFASWLCYCTDVAQWRSVKHCTVFGRLWAGTLYILRALPPNVIFPAAKFTLRPSLAFSYIGSVNARHSSSGCQPNFVAWYFQ